jgi:hypothetical protein
MGVAERRRSGWTNVDLLCGLSGVHGWSGPVGADSPPSLAMSRCSSGGGVPLNLALTPTALTYFPRLLGQHAEVFSRRPGRFRLEAALFDTAARLLDVLSRVLRRFPCALSLDAMVFRRSFGHLSPDDDGLYVSPFLTTMTDGRGAWLSG